MKLQVIVKASARHSKIEKVDEGTYRLAVKAQPQEGKANAEVIAQLAKFFSVPKSAVTIIRGGKSKQKIVEIDDEAL